MLQSAACLQTRLYFPEIFQIQAVYHIQNLFEIRSRILPTDLIFRDTRAIPFLAVRVHAIVGEEAIVCALNDVEPG